MISRGDLNNLLKVELNISPTEMIKDILTKMIIEDLVGTELPMKGIFYRFGFRNRATFTRFFKANTGYTPTRYHALNYRVKLQNRRS